MLLISEQLIINALETLIGSVTYGGVQVTKLERCNAHGGIGPGGLAFSIAKFHVMRWF